MPTQSFFRKWIFASKINSWPKLLVPFILGQAMGLEYAGKVDFISFVLALLFTICGLLFIVYLNDYGDQSVDSIKRKMYPTSSGKTIPDGVLPPGHLLVAGLLVAAIGFSAAFALASIKDIAALFPYAIGCSLVFVAYTFPPLKLNYRGGGELLEGVGVGLVLPLFSAYMQCGEWVVPEYTFLLSAYASLSFASAIASGLSDELSDIEGGKATIVTLFGNQRAKTFINLFITLSILLLCTSIFMIDSIILGVGVATAVVWIIWNWLRLMNISGKAQTAHFPELSAYKGRLHALIWGSGIIVSVALIMIPLIEWLD